MHSPSEAETGEQLQQYVQEVIDTAARVRLPQLFRARPPDAVYWCADRNGITTVALRTRGIAAEALIELLKYRFGQYVHPAVDIVNTRLTFEAGMRHGSPGYESPEDIHFLAGSRETGEVHGYTVLRTLEAQPGTTLATWERPLFPLERIHGWGVFNRLQAVPDIPMERIWELGRCAQNQQLDTSGEMYLRAEAEIGVALCRSLAGPLRDEAPLVIGDVEMGAPLASLEFLHLPAILIRGTVPYASEASFYTPRYERNTVYPFALLSADLAETVERRLSRIEAALALPGEAGHAVLEALKGDARLLHSSLEPPGGLPALNAAELSQPAMAMDARRSMLQMGECLRLIDLFAELSDAEIRILGTFMHRRRVAAGDFIVRQGEPGDALYLIESGRVEAQARGPSGERVSLATLGAGDHFGEIALVVGGVRTADVVAVTEASVLRLGQGDYHEYLAQLSEVRDGIARTATQRSRDTSAKSPLEESNEEAGGEPA